MGSRNIPGRCYLVLVRKSKCNLLLDAQTVWSDVTAEVTAALAANRTLHILVRDPHRSPGGPHTSGMVYHRLGRPAVGEHVTVCCLWT